MEQGHARLQVRLHGVVYLMWADNDPRIPGTNGPIMRPGDFEEFRDSYAHLFSDGIVRRYSKEIAKAEDLEVLGEADPSYISDLWRSPAPVEES